LNGVAKSGGEPAYEIREGEKVLSNNFEIEFSLRIQNAVAPSCAKNIRACGRMGEQVLLVRGRVLLQGKGRQMRTLATNVTSKWTGKLNSGIMTL